MWKFLLITILAITGLTFYLYRSVETEEPRIEKKSEDLGELERTPENPRESEIKPEPITETKPKVKKPIDKPLGAVYKYNGTGFLGAWKDQTGEERFYDQDGKFYTNTQEIKDMQKPKAITATSTQ